MFPTVKVTDAFVPLIETTFPRVYLHGASFGKPSATAEVPSTRLIVPSVMNVVLSFDTSTATLEAPAPDEVVPDKKKVLRLPQISWEAPAPVAVAASNNFTVAT